MIGNFLREITRIYLFSPSLFIVIFLRVEIGLVLIITRETRFYYCLLL